MNTPNLINMFVSHLKNGWLAAQAEFFKNTRKFLVSNVNCHDAGIAMPYKRTKVYEKDPKDTPDRVFKNIECSITFGTEGVL
jgi:hypothetical protein